MCARYDPDKDHRRSVRLKGYDYAEAGAYFITIVAQMREPFFGEVLDSEMRLNHAGRIVARWWMRLQGKFPSVETDEYVVMPDHLHGILVNVGADLRVRPGPGTPTPTQRETPATLPTIVQWFKTMTTNEYIRGVRDLGWTPFERRLWQRSYYDRVIRDENELNLARQYILDNPQKWTPDEVTSRKRGGPQAGPLPNAET